MEAPILEPGLNEVFPNINERRNFPKQVINMKQTPDGSEWWIAGLEGKVRKVSEQKLRVETAEREERERGERERKREREGGREEERNQDTRTDSGRQMHVRASSKIGSRMFGGVDRKYAGSLRSWVDWDRRVTPRRVREQQLLLPPWCCVVNPITVNYGRKSSEGFWG